MSKFVIKNIREVNGIQECKQIVILKNDENPEAISEEQPGVFDEYQAELQQKYTNSFIGIVSIMNRVANLQTVSPDKFKDITPHGESVKEFEFKFGDLRVYAIKIPGGKLTILCGYKNRQKKDISKFRSLKKQYLAHIKYNE